MTLLYIDDDAEDREFFKEAVDQLDPSILCHTAQDGAEGLKALRDLIVMPDFIFVDVNMPLMNGKQFLVEIKKQIRLRSIPVIIYSTTSHPEELKTFQRLGAFKVLVKPASMAGITRMIRSVVRHETETADREMHLRR